MSDLARRPLLPAVAAAAVAVLLAAGSAASFPGANGKIAFVRGATIFTISGTTETSVVTGAHPAFSADGTKIAFDDGTNVKTIKPDGTGVSGNLATGTDPAWSPDGNQLAYVKAGDLYTLVLGGAETQRTSTGGVTEPAWSPDGRKIAFVQGGDVKLFTIAGATTTNLTNSATTNAAPTWSPDGARIAFTSNRDGNVELYSMNADGTAQTRLTSTTTIAEATPSWSPDGTKIAFTKPDSGGNVDVWAYTVADGTLTQITTNAANDVQPDWGSAFSLSTPVVDAPDGVVDGSTLTVLPVTYTGDTPPTGYSYQWQRCNPSGTTCTSISGATDSSYTLVSLDVGSTIRVVVTGQSDSGNASASSAPTTVVAALAPASSSVPTITGGSAPAVGVALSSGTGTWRGTTPMSFARQWLRCNTSGASCSAISGATGASYTPATADVGSTLRVQVTANNGVGSAAVAQSAPTGVVIESTPKNTTKPTITGTLKSASFLTADPGDWAGAPTISFAYVWQRCTTGGTCSNVSGATSSFYTLTTADIGFKMRVQVTGTNTFGSTVATSDQTDVITGTLPTVSTLPFVSGVPAVGEVLFASQGTWLGTPTSFSYEWRRCVGSSGTCTAISGATGSSYTVVSADVGSTILVVVSAVNSSGTTSASSARTLAVTATNPNPTPTRPVNTIVPAIKGVLAKGGTLTASPGTWTGSPASYGYQWERCPATTTVCVQIPNATKSTYAPVAADVGKRLRVTVQAISTGGVGIATSVVTGVVRATAVATPVRLTGDAKANTLVGGAGNDVIHGEGGNDRLDGKAGNDKLYGDAGNDTIVGGPGRDLIFGGPGNDAIDSVDRERDVVDCGPGIDRVRADKIDVLRNCEKVTRVATKKKKTAAKRATSGAAVTARRRA